MPEKISTCEPVRDSTQGTKNCLKKYAREPSLSGKVFFNS